MDGCARAGFAANRRSKTNMSRPIRAGDSAFEKGLKGSDIPAQAEGLGKIPAKRNLSPEGAERSKAEFSEEGGVRW